MDSIAQNFAEQALTLVQHNDKRLDRHLEKQDLHNQKVLDLINQIQKDYHEMELRIIKKIDEIRIEHIRDDKATNLKLYGIIGLISTFTHWISKGIDKIF